MIRLELPEPPSANRYWRVWRGRTVKSAEARAYQAAVRVLAVNAKVRPLRGDVRVLVVWRRSRRTGDTGNRYKVVEDALNGIAYQDDKQVRRLTIERIDKGEPGYTRPGVTVTVEAA